MSIRRRDVRTLITQERIARDNFAIDCIIQGANRSELRTRMQNNGYYFDNKEYTIWRKSAYDIQQQEYAHLALTEAEIAELDLFTVHRSPYQPE